MENNIVKVGDILEGVVIKITDFGAFIKLDNGGKGLIHISQISDNFVKNINDYIKVGDRVMGRVIKVTNEGKIDLTLKTKDKQKNFPKEKEFRNTIFEEKLEKFLKTSEKLVSEKE